MTNTILILIPSVVKQVCVCVNGGAGVWGRGLEERKTLPSPAGPSIHTLESNAPWFVNIYQTPTGWGGGKVSSNFQRFPRRQKQYPPSPLGKRTPRCLERFGSAFLCLLRLLLSLKSFPPSPGVSPCPQSESLLCLLLSPSQPHPCCSFLFASLFSPLPPLFPPSLLQNYFPAFYLLC